MFSTRWKVFWNTSAQVIGRVAGAGTTFLISIIIARTYGAYGYGEFSKVTTFVAMFYLIADFGLNAIYLQKDHEEKGTNAYGQLVGIRLLLGAILAFLALAILSFIPRGTGQGYTDSVRLGIIVFVPSIIFQALMTTSNALFQKYLRYDLATIAIIVGSGVSLLMVWIFSNMLVLGAGVLGSTTAILLGSCVSACVAFIYVRKFKEQYAPSLSLSSLRSYFFRALPLGATLLFNLIYFRVDQIILALTRPTSEVGLYGFSYKIFEFPLAIPIFFMNALYPTMVKANVLSLRTITKKSLMVLIPVSCVLTIIVWVAAPMVGVVREEFIGSVVSIRILSLGLPLFFLSGLAMWTLIAMKKQTLLAGIYGVSMLVTILLDAWLIPIHGMFAAAWVTVGSEGLVLLLSSLYLRTGLRHFMEVPKESTNDKFTNMQMNDGMKK